MTQEEFVNQLNKNGAGKHAFILPCCDKGDSPVTDYLGTLIRAKSVKLGILIEFSSGRFLLISQIGLFHEVNEAEAESESITIGTLFFSLYIEGMQGLHAR